MKSIACSILPVLLFLLPAVALGQATLQGTVTDSTSKEKMIAVNVSIVGTALGAATDIEGSYRISGISLRVATVKVSCIGYMTKTVQIDFAATPDARLDIRMTQEIIAGEEVVITAQRRGQIAAMNQQITSNTIVNVISEEKIKELPDANAAEAIGRLPGVSLLRSGGEANKVILRGLSDKFTTVTIDGVRIATTDADSRGVDLSAISQGSLSGVELFKALTPDKDGDAIAGSVNLVTRKAPSERLIQLDLKGDYNKLMNSVKQYDFGARYGERFFDDILGVQVIGNLESRIRSNEATSISYQNYFNHTPPDYFISNFRLQFQDEIRKRQGAVLLLDVDTPDSGSVRASANFSQTQRDFLTSNRNYPTNEGNTQIFYEARDQQQTITEFTGSLRGENHVLGLTATWGASFAQSATKYPFDYYLDFYESEGAKDSAGHATAGMDLPASFRISTNPGAIIPYAVNNFRATTLDSGIFSSERNLEIQKTGYIDLKGHYVVGDFLSGELKAGGKARVTNRSKSASREFAAYYLGGAWKEKNLGGTLFDAFYQRHVLRPLTTTPTLIDFLGSSPAGRNMFDQYRLYPLMGKDYVHDWYTLNTIDYAVDNSADLDYYNVTERVSAAYVMNTFDIGQFATLVAGVRMEQESNDYRSRFVPGAGSLGGFPTPTGQTKDTMTSYKETDWLPNLQMNIRPTEFLSVRLAAYAALARPDYNARLIKLYGLATGTGNSVYVGNPYLRSSKAKNYEINASVFSTSIGLVSVSAFYKEIKDDIHVLNAAGFIGHQFLDSMGIKWNTSLTRNGYSLTMPYNSSAPSKVWGLEFEHQANLSFLPGYFQFLILSYNFSFVRSETHLISTKTLTTYDTTYSEFGNIITPRYLNVVVDRKQKLEGQPQFFGNVALGYDIGDFSARLSLFYQGEYNTSFSPDGKSDGVSGKFSRLDLTVKQKLTSTIALLLAVNNLLDSKEETYSVNTVDKWRRLSSSRRYGMTADIGVRVNL